jgi:hypothetical protein
MPSSRSSRRLTTPKQPPAGVERGLAATGRRAIGQAMTHVFKDAKMLYAVLVEFYELLKNNPEIGPKLAQSNLCVQFRYKNPSAVITIDATGDDLKIIQGEFDGHRRSS